MSSLVYIAAMLLIVIGSLIIIISLIDSDEESGCSLTYFEAHCSPSGWISFIMGEVAIGMALGLFLYFLGSRNNAKLDETIRSIENMVQVENSIRTRRMLYTNHSLKNHFSVILLNVGMMNRALQKSQKYDELPQGIRERYSGITLSVQRAYETLTMAAELFDPMLTEDIRQLLHKIDTTNPSSGVGMGFPGYNDIKGRVKQCTERLDSEIEKLYQVDQ